MAALADLGVIGSPSEPRVLQPIGGSTFADEAGWFSGRPHAIHNDWLAFRSPDKALISKVDEFLGSANHVVEPTVYFDLEPTGDGFIRLHAAEPWLFHDRNQLFTQLAGVVNDFAVRTQSCALLHAGGVRTPSGRTVLISGPEEAGKSTLTAALVSAGCDYLTDELAGIQPHSGNALAYPKPLELDASSRHVLGLPEREVDYVRPGELNTESLALTGSVGPIDEIILTRYEKGATTIASRLTPAEALRELLAQTLNLLRSGSEGLLAISQLAEQVPVTRIVHGDSIALAEHIISAQRHYSESEATERPGEVR